MGLFGHRELAIHGTTCSDIQLLLPRFQNALSAHSIAYVDESHDPTSTLPWDQITIQGSGANLSLSTNTSIELQSRLRAADLILINGNHFGGENQVIVYQSEKEKSLIKRRDQMTNVLAFVGPKADFERMRADGFPLQETTHFNDLQDPSFWQLLNNWIGQSTVKALLLTGGKSLRMGTDKSLMMHHQIPHYKHVQNLCSTAQLPVLLSCRSEQVSNYDWPTTMIIADRLLDIGPLAGLISAWMSDPHSAFLTIACDMPNLTERSIQQVLQQRQPKALATTMTIKSKGLPEPMLTIWEPKAYRLVLDALSLGITCPRKILQHPNVHSVVANFPDELKNVNTPEDIQMTAS